MINAKAFTASALLLISLAGCSTAKDTGTKTNTETSSVKLATPSPGPTKNPTPKPTKKQAPSLKEIVPAPMPFVEPVTSTSPVEPAPVVTTPPPAVAKAPAPSPAPAPVTPVEAPKYVAPPTTPKPAPKPVQSAPAPSSGGYNWAGLAQCESGGNPTAVSPGGLYHGLYQFSPQTWASVGGTGLPSQASPAEQTKRAQMLANQATPASQWPVCHTNM